jgi:hypothetical protein
MHGEISQKDKMVAFSAGIAVGLAVLFISLYQFPAVRNRIDWRVDFAMTYVRGLLDPVRPMPTPLPAAQLGIGGGQEGDGEGPFPGMAGQALTPSATPTQRATATQVVENTPAPTATPAPTLTPTAIPAKAEVPAPAYEKQDLNNCGPATLAMHLRYYGWSGDQKTISDVIKPLREDRNVNVEELVSYVLTKTPGYEIQYRVGGDIEILKRLIAAGFPVTVEKSFIMEESYWMNDDRWSGHYLLLTGYDDAVQRFTAQDVFVGPNLSIPYSELDKHWKAFNRVYILVYPPEQREQVQSILGSQWNIEQNRQHALDLAKNETEADPTDSYAWFNYGTNLVYFEKYSQAAAAYDQARTHGLPQRMLRYQFGPFFAYFHTGRMEDLQAVIDYALKRTPNSEEALLWNGWAMYRLGNRDEAMKSFQSALAARPNYPDAEYGIRFLLEN